MSSFWGCWGSPRDKAPANGALFLFSKRQMAGLLREAGIVEDEALQLLATAVSGF